MNAATLARLRRLEASVPFRRWQAAQRLAELPDDPSEIRRRYDELVSGLPDPELARYRRLAASARRVTEPQHGALKPATHLVPSRGAKSKLPSRR